MSIKRSLLISLLFVLIQGLTFDASAQVGDNGSLLKMNIMPPSPEAVSLGKYGETPVSLYTGIPNISIPLYDVAGRRLSSPISLSYHAGGIKVEETASRVGLGWSLNAGGLITRTIRGIADDSADGWLYNGFTYSGFLVKTTAEKNIIYENITNGNYDAEADLYYYNFNGQSGKFYFNDQRNIVTIPFTRITINYVQSGGLITQWIITDELGNVYYFGKSKNGTVSSKEITTSQSGCASQIPTTQVSTSSWNLLEVYDLNGEDVLTYEYEPYIINQCMSASSSKYMLIPAESSSYCSSKPDLNCYSFLTTDGMRIKSIRSSKTKADFSYGNSRIDLPGDRVLEKVKINNLDGTLIKEFWFSYDYFISSGNFSPALYCNQSVDRTKRLKLISVQERSLNDSNPPYSFVYEAQNLPERLSFGQDHWGLANGVTTNNTMVPSFEYHSGTDHFYVPGADREPNLVYSKSNILKSIKYPTGGTTEFEYELNTALSPFLPYQKESKITPSLVGNGTAMNYSQTFVVNSYGSLGAFILRKIQNVNCNLTELTCGISFTIQGVTNPAYVLNVNNVLSHFYLPNGTYTYKVNISQLSNDNKYFTSNLEWTQNKSVEDKPAGGLRVKSIINKDGTTVITSKFYDYTDPSTMLTSGSIPSYFKYEYPIVEMSKSTMDGMNQATIYYNCSFLVRSSISKVPLATTQGSSAGYSIVTEREHSNALNGKTIYKFISPKGLPDVFYDSYPFGSPQSKDWMRGVQTGKSVYKNENGTFKILQKEINQYEDFLPYSSDAIGLTVGFSPVMNYPTIKTFITQSSFTLSGLRRLKSNSVTSYSYSETNQLLDSLTTSSYFYYGEPLHLQKTKQKVYTSNGDSIVTIFKYPHDLIAGTVKSELLSRNFIAASLEEYLKSGNNLIRGASKKEYVVESGKVRLKNIWLAEFANGGGISESQISMTPFVKRASYSDYDNIGNVTSFSKENDMKESYVWGYNNSLPIAKVINATPASVFYTGFEEDGNSAVNDARTGFKSWTGTFLKSITGLTPGLYTLSYWLKTGSVWAIQKSDVNVTGSTYSISLTGQVDEVRFHPSSAQMITYTYNKSLGVQTVADENNRISFYLYDGMNRLIAIKDDQGNYLKQVSYHFRDNGQ